MSVQNAAGTAKCNTAGQSCPLSTDISGRLFLGGVIPGTGATNLGKAEDAVHVTADTGVMMMGVIDTSASSGFGGANGDYTPPAMNATGAQYVNIDSNSQVSTSRGILKLEDNVVSSADAGVGALYKAQDPLTVDQATGDYVLPKTDLTGRILTGPAPHTEFWQGCGTATATTADVAIKAAVASNRIYITAITCKSTSATVASSLDFKDGSTVIAAGGIAQMAAASPGSFSASFPTPLRGTSNTAFNFATNISVSSVTCCGNGFISVD